ncbi:hypothetical protein SAMN04488026_10323 [Aliiruegeria lutimaris]|uniref:DUF192 domain-containing protein n=2 Tax=Aliiruegeria lutimaris TaxID=571298 RepID=A0A1G8ZF87_9RHOB|nr:hypothetical protein SAMN04488026_10323 [Aliiruegeria lutimaris]
MRNWQKLLIIPLLLAICSQQALAECSLDRLDLRGPWGSARFSVELADDPGERAQGLMFRDHLPRSAGMLFVYEKAGPVSFWMKNTRIPLDMIFADQRGVVTRVHSSAIPGDLTPIDGGDGVLVVLEVNGGLAEALGISAGDELRHPALGPEAAWSCVR